MASFQEQLKFFLNNKIKFILFYARISHSHSSVLSTCSSSSQTEYVVIPVVCGFVF